MSTRSFFGPLLFSIVAVLAGCGSDDGSTTGPNGEERSRDDGELVEAAPAAGSLILEAPKDRRADAGSEVTIAARVADGARIEWLRDGQLVAGASSASLSLSPAKLRDAGRYTLRATSTDGRVEEAHCSLSVTGLEQILGSQGGASFRDGPRLDARFAQPMGIARDPNGNLYVADRGNHVIRRIATDGTVTVLAGSPGDVGGADGKGSAARFDAPEGIAYANGALYVADKNNHAIRKLLLDGTVTTLAGTPGFSGTSDGPGTTAQFKRPSDIVAIGSALYVADTSNHCIRKIDIGTGAVTTFAGTKASVGELDGAPGALYSPARIALGPAGKLYVADAVRLAEITVATGSIATVLAGGYKVEGAQSVAYDHASGALYFGRYGHLRKLAAGQETIVAGSWELGSADGAGATARFWDVRSLAFDADGTLLVSDADNGAIRRVAVSAPDVAVTTFAGKTREGHVVDGDGATARVAGISSLAIDDAGFTYATDDRAHVIRRIAPDGTMTTFAGKAFEGGMADGPGAQARFGQLRAITFDPKGRLLIADGCKLRFATMNGHVGSLGGQLNVCSGVASGSLSNVFLDKTKSIVVDSDGMIYLAGDKRIIRVTPDGYVSMLAGDLAGGPAKDGVGKDARFELLSGIVLGKDAALYGADGLTVRRISLAGEVTTIAGVSNVSGHADGTGAQARFAAVDTMTLDPKTGDLIVGDRQNATIRRVTTTGAVTTIAGRPGWSSFQAGALPGGLVGPSALVARPDGRLLVGTDARLVSIGL